MDIKEVFARNLRRIRREAGLSQEHLADLAQVDRTYVSSLERCVYAASVDKVERLAAVLGVTASKLLEREPGDGPTGASKAPDDTDAR